MSDDSNQWGSYANNGDDFGNNFYFDDVGNFSAGQGTPPGAACVGIIVSKWTTKTVKFGFGSAYDRFGTWHITAGDTYAVTIDGSEGTGPGTGTGTGTGTVEFGA